MVDNYFTHDDQQRNSYNWELLQERRIALNRANTEIDLLVDGIRTRTQATTVQAKELEQKFGILMSAKQAQIDFEIWAGELMSSSRSIAILFVDIDNFKPLNTRYTETIIDETVLPDVMKLIQNFIRFRGGAYRHGGEEFLVILPNSDSSEASAFAEKLRAAFESTDFKVKEQVERLTISIGIALWPQHGSTYDEVLKMANEAESEAKGTKNACVVTKK